MKILSTEEQRCIKSCSVTLLGTTAEHQTFKAGHASTKAKWSLYQSKVKSTVGNYAKHWLCSLKLISIPNYKTYKVTFSDLVSKCDVMQKMKRENRKTGKMTTWINIVHSLASEDTIKHFVCECGSVKLAGNITTSLAGWVLSTNTGNNPPRQSKQCSRTTYIWKHILTHALPASLKMTTLMVGLIGDLYAQQMDSLFFEMAHHQNQTVTGQHHWSTERKESSHPQQCLNNILVAEHFVHCSSIRQKVRQLLEKNHHPHLHGQK